MKTKSNFTDLAVKLSDVEPNRHSIKRILALIEDKKEYALVVIEDLELQLEKEKTSEEANKVSEESDLLID